MSERISTEQVAHVARLARLDLTDDELEHVHRAARGRSSTTPPTSRRSTSTTSPPTAHPLPLRNVLRDDVVRPCLDRDEVLAAAPAAEDGRFRVPPILGEAP